jgi:ribosomal protein L24
LKVGDPIKVISGKFKGKIDCISSLDILKQRVFLENTTREKYDKSIPETKKKEIMISVHVSNVAY